MSPSTLQEMTIPVRAPHPPRRRVKHRRWLWQASLANVGGLGLLYLLERVIAERFWLTALLAYAPQHIFLVPTLALLAVGLRRPHSRSVRLNLLVLAVFTVSFLGFNLPLHRAAAGTGRPLRVMTYNVGRLRHGEAKDILALATRERADVVCVQEALEQYWDRPHQELLRSFRGWNIAVQREIITFSRDPMVVVAREQLPGAEDRHVLVTRIERGGKTLTILNTHLSTGSRPGTVEGTETWPGYLRHAAQLRRRQVQAVLDRAGRYQGPMLVVGDFNMPPRGLAYGAVRARFQDAFQTAGRGFGYTYRPWRPTMRIDYIYASPTLPVRGCWAISSELSDHRPVLAELEW